ncbi:protein transport protein bet1 [Hypoxylon texense]
MHLELEQAAQLETRGPIANAASEGVNAVVAQIMARENDLNEKPVSANTVAIALGVWQKREDAADKYKSMDFGLDESAAVKGNKRRSFFGKEKDPSHKTQLSMDMNLSSPYLLPPNMHNSRESLNSLAKGLHQNDDPYRPVTSYAGSDVGSLRSFQRGPDRDSSVYGGKPRSVADRDPSRNRPTINTRGDLPPRQRSLPSSPLQPLPPVAQPQSARESTGDVPPLPAKNEFRFVDDSPAVPHVPEIQMPAAVASPITPSPPNSRPLSNESFGANQSSVARPANNVDSMTLPTFENHQQGLGIADTRASQNSAGISLRDSSALPTNVRPPRKESLPVGSDFAQDYQDYAAHFQVDGPDHANGDLHMPQHVDEHDYPHSAGLGVPQQDSKRLSVGFRPLPPDDFLESEDPEFRANRIRSFYKEYFDDSAPKTDAGRPPPIPQQATYYEDYDAGYLGDTAFFDPETNAFVMPYAQPVTRRAMTPPPKSRRPMPGPGPRGPHGPHGPHGSMNMPGGPHGRPRAGSTMSAARWAPMSPRPGSSASNQRFPGAKPRKPMPPPAALSTLPTPSKLKDDSFALMGAIDFAPPPTFKDVARGRSQSPLGERKPYALNTPIHSPLVSAFDETPALPSPHLLRKSGTFTALDFAPPRRFKDPDSMSDSGSVVSNRSGISSANLSAIRAGAGRVSRLPGDTVFTQAALGDTLKPSWNMRD